MVAAICIVLAIWTGEWNWVWTALVLDLGLGLAFSRR